MVDTTDRPICGYELAEGTLCPDPREGTRCATHALSLHAVCTSCGGSAFRECAEKLPGGQFCRRALCLGCGHSFDGDHAPINDSMVPPEQDQQGPRREVPQGLRELRMDVIAAVARMLTEAQQENKIVFTGQVTVHDMAITLVDGMSTHTMIMSLSAIATAVPTS